MEIHINCQICGSNFLHKKLVVRDHFLTNEEFELIECQNCGLIFTHPVPDRKELSRYYQSDEYISHNASRENFLSFIYRQIRNYSYKSKFKLIKNYSNKGNALDIGSGTGEFLNFLRSKYFDVTGIEPDSTARIFAIEKYNLDVFEERQLERFKNNSFDLITMWHVLEHVNDLNARIQIVKELLKISGTIFIAVPNPNSYDAKYYKEFWAAWDVPRHLFHFSKESLEKLLNKFDLKIVNVKPLIFDAFYISLLSEKYKSKKVKYFKSFITGLTSNRQARVKNLGYSSQIYIVKNKDNLQS
jgi:predicted SAM-dependent methyltransferase